MNRPALAQRLRDSIVVAVRAFRRERPDERPYAFALVGGQAGNYIGFAIATEEGLRETAKKYAESGYRYEGWEWEEVDHAERLAVWLRWANPDDGWRYGDFDDSEALCRSLRLLFDRAELTDESGSFEAFCTDDVLSPLSRDPNWARDPLSRSLIAGFTYGEDPRDFLRSATRANPYPLVIALWGEHWQAQEVEPRIKTPS
jgi:hypothetical protein